MTGGAALPTAYEELHRRLEVPSDELCLRQEVVPVQDEMDVRLARQACRRMAELLASRMGEINLAALLTATSEVATNVVFHAGQGVIVVQMVNTLRGLGIRVTAVDRGPGIPNVELAMQDGFSTRGGLGSGLSGAERLSDQFSIWSEVGVGTVVSLLRVSDEKARLDGRRAGAKAWEGRRVHVGTAVRSAPGDGPCGDAHFYGECEGVQTLAVVDGLGHGRRAYAAACAATSYLSRHYMKPVQEVFQGLESALAETAGAAVSVVRIDEARSSVVFAGIGNVRGRLLLEDEVYLEPLPGIVGEGRSEYVATSFRYQAGAVITLFTDGLSDRVKLSDLPLPVLTNPRQCANELLARYWRGTDDALVLSAR